jgi:phosphohistidine phosphatase
LNLYILRHGEAGTRAPIPSRDAERSLTVAGRREVQDIAESIDTLGVKFDKILTSPLRRAHETAAIVARTLKSLNKLEDSDDLRPEGNRTELYRRLSNFRQDDLILLVGHEPYLSTLISEVISGSTNSRISLKKAGMAKLRINSFLPKPSGELRWLLTPKQIRRMS